MTEPIKLSAFVVPELGKQRIDAQWGRIAERRPLGEKRSGRLVPALGAFALLGALTVLWWPHAAPTESASVWEGSVVASDDAPVDMTLAEGTHIKVEPRSEVKLLHSAADAVQVRLSHGSARFEVAKKPSRRFSVHLGSIEVVVTGTQFRVLRRAAPTGESVHVEVLEGSVEVHRQGGGLVALRAGERWSTVIGSEQREQPAVAAPLEPEPNAPAAQGVSGSEHEPAEEAAEEEPEAEGAAVGVDDEIDSGEQASEDRPQRRRRAKLGAEELFDHANLARRAGRLDDAAELYGKLVAVHPNDRRAPLAAFELGRLRMDSLRDVRGAIQALERALKLAPQGTFAEDALARLVLAQEALHDRARCNRARTRYLARYPEGVHAQHVAERCGGS
jgi:transmembrane sensor